MQKYANLIELEKCCPTHIFLQNFVLIQPRTSPPKICNKSPNSADFATPNPLFAGLPVRVGALRREDERAAVVREGLLLVPDSPVYGKFSGKCRSFSAVSAPIFASKYTFFSIFQNLPDYLADIFEIWRNLAKFCRFCNIIDLQTFC